MATWGPSLQAALAGLVVASFVASAARAAAVCGGTFSFSDDLAAGTAGHVRALTYAESGATKILVAGGEDMTLRVWDVDPVVTTPREYGRHQETIWALEWISDLDVVASACGDGLIRLWPISVLSTTQTCDGLGENCCDGDGLGCSGEHVLHWHSFGNSMLKRRQCHSLEWISNGDGTGTLVSGWGDGSVRTWAYDGSTWSYTTNLQSVGWDIADRTYDMVWLSGASKLATASPDWSQPRLWSDLTTADSYTYLQKQTGEHGCPGTNMHCDAVLGLDGNSDGSKVVTCSKDTRVIIWQASDGSKVATLSAHTDHVESVVWLHSEDLIASGGADTNILIWDATASADGTTAAQTLAGHSGSVQALVWIEGLKLLASADDSGEVKTWDCA
mmetsp:Transcript_75469/g.157398  ORF Transcript_75469/g.157398 Transcript_75469/m.157398 type:complete len:388 (+) Transcript_75469:129-1292(+)|eukprot:CAMPEP_0206421620 /NCGR_PEP_ID=MMETSP0324_2-20121206/1553_1 /ASSEMBLY_ACC=CAM_ASM_000836 /TAXON_ID=2866 /ORGANISM="Crypthecodinium cohnii, Strain Seligo" /LENGTH=387 /DNA_ID=CAMNT_0053885743 /DNA_START=59 /DNA_END=1222 /DNA_ORIENTATION=+